MLLGENHVQLPLLELFLGFTTVVFFFHQYVDWRQLQALKVKSPPKEVEGTDLADPAEFSKTRHYSIDKWYFNAYQSCYSLLETWAIFLVGALPYAWRLSGTLLHQTNALLGPAFWPDSAQAVTDMLADDGNTLAQCCQSALFVLLLIYAQTLLSLPWTMYFTFVVEQRHGFNKQTPRLFLWDALFSVLLTGIFAPPLTMAITYILIWGGTWLPFYLCGFMLCMSLLFMTIYPTLIQPLFNKCEPLPEGSLRSKIEALASSLKFPLKKLFTIDGSKRSAHSNAYMYGFFSNKRIVLFDTLVNSCTEEECVAVLAHELGHWKLGHTMMLFSGMQVYTLIQFSLFAAIRSSPHLYSSFGFGAELGTPAIVSLLLFLLVVSPVDEVLSLLLNIVSRAFEFKADAFAAGLGYGKELRAALLRLSKENKGALHVDPWFSAMHYSHPPLVQRLGAIDANVDQKKRL